MLLENKERYFIPPTIETYKTYILVKYIRNKSFHRAHTKTIISARFWSPHNNNILTFRYIRVTMTAYENFREIEYDVFIRPHSHTPDISEITHDTSPTYDT